MTIERQRRARRAARRGAAEGAQLDDEVRELPRILKLEEERDTARARIAELESFVQFHRAKVTGLNERIAELEEAKAALLRGLRQMLNDMDAYDGDPFDLSHVRGLHEITRSADPPDVAAVLRALGVGT